MYVREESSWLKHADFLILDMICVQISLILSYCIRHGWDSLPFANNDYLLLDIILCLGCIIVGATTHVYSDILRRGYAKEFFSLLKEILFVFLVVFAVLFLLKKTSAYSRTTLTLLPVFLIVLVYPLRLLWKKHLGREDVSGKQKSLMIVAEKSQIDAITKQIKDSKVAKYKITARILAEDIVNGKTKAEDIAHQWVDEVIIDNSQPSEPFAEFEKELEEMGVVIHRLLDTKGKEHRSVYYEEVAGLPVLTASVNEVTLSQAVLKRMADIFGGLVGGVFCLLILIIVGPIIYAKDPGPVIFKQVRVGKNGKKFKLLKIRSMYKDAEKRKKELESLNKVQDGMMFKIDNDPRILPGIGTFIRKTSLDEFPQFFNVLSGDMSLVGTRPPTVDEWEKYKSRHRLRLAIKPGITGMWQVSGRSEITDFEEVLKLDTDYIYNWTPGLDLRILMQTVKNVLARKGAEYAFLRDHRIAMVRLGA